MGKTLAESFRKLFEFFFGIVNIQNHFIIGNGDLSAVVVLGAGKGEFSETILRKCPTCRIVMVEPNPILAQELVRKFGDQENVKILEAAVGSKAANNCRFYMSENWQENSLYASLIREERQREISVRMITLEDVFSQLNCETVDLLKVDIEGAEWDLIQHSPKKYFDRIRQITVEFHDFIDPAMRKRSEKCINRLKEFGYSFIHKGTDYLCGTPYYNCLFYDRRSLRWNIGAKWLWVPRQLISKI